jgi:hypothetical protein
MKLEKILGKMNEDKLYEMAVPILAQKLKDPIFTALMRSNPDAAAAQLRPIVITAVDRNPLDYDRVIGILKSKFGIVVKSPGAIAVLQKATTAQLTAPSAVPAQKSAQPTGVTQV